jgi:hypothetical protein
MVANGGCAMTKNKARRIIKREEKRRIAELRRFPIQPLYYGGISIWKHIMSSNGLNLNNDEWDILTEWAEERLPMKDSEKMSS